MVKRIAVIGAQTGDEGKGVRAVYYVREAVRKSNNFGNFGDSKPSVYTLRWQGGANAGHTVEMNGERYALHQLPSGILIPGTYNLMGEGVFLEPRASISEIEDLRKKGIKIEPNNFGIASNAHVTLDYHIESDKSSSAARTGHTSTGRGIKPTAIDKYGRVGIRFAEFLDETSFTIALGQRFPDGLPLEFGTIESFVKSYSNERKQLNDFLVLQSEVLNRKNFGLGIGEGAQGFQLDIDRGLYPGVTSSNPSVVPFRAHRIIGVVKMYESSVGGGRPFVGRMEEKLETPLREAWSEYGTTTKKPRSIGWLDIVALKHAIQSSEIDGLVSTCGDRLEELNKINENIRLITGYKIKDKIFNSWDKTFHRREVLNEAVPIFEEFEPWGKFYDKDSRSLSHEATRLVDRIEELTGIPFVAHGYGPGIDDVYEVKDIITPLLSEK